MKILLQKKITELESNIRALKLRIENMEHLHSCRYRGDDRTIGIATIAQKSCWPWAHRWAKWVTIETGDMLLIDPDTGKTLAKTGSFEKQRRECGICGIAQLRKQITETV